MHCHMTDDLLERFKEWSAWDMLWVQWLRNEDHKSATGTRHDPTDATGEVISEKDRCTDCRGGKVTVERKALEVHVEKGMRHGQKITFQGEDDEAFTLTHLDGRQLLIKSNPGKVIKPGQYKAINDEGMPHFQRPFMKGRLYIHFKVEFPDSGVLSPDQCHLLETILPPRPENHLTEMEVNGCEGTTLHDANMEEEMRQKEQQHQEAYNEDYERAAPRVQCAQQ